MKTALLEKLNKGEIIKRIEDFKKGVKAYSDLLLASRDSVMPEIVRNHGLIDEAKSKLIKLHAELEKYIAVFGNNPKMNDGVWNVMYSPYNNAFTSDTIVRVGPSVDAVVDDLNVVLGRLEAISEKEFGERINPPKKGIGVVNNKWNYCNPFWLTWKLIEFAWKHKIISGIFLLIIIPLLVAYIQHWLGWNQ